ncbi:DUF4349 domain-containing protein [Alkalicoccus daliensis]|uniref:DUF4349 domain-containing protein n=1 Tax=Alkalicoccus daliensis TaxID=745820 RepID=A0A1H0E8N1_9BACI|nr:DUF4349 domain-containing protein [Alkalicoccus daliensis]SDN78679.1 protein of unknown function [Alkalicoccus daliensis]
MKRKHYVLFLLLAAVLIVLGACMNQADNNQTADNRNTEEAVDDGGGLIESNEEAADAPAEEDGAQEDFPESEEAPTADQTGQMVIYNGHISIEVDNYDAIQSAIQEQVDSMSGYVVESNVQQAGENEERSGRIVVRIPQEHFHPFLQELESASTTVVEQSTSGNDVSEEYVDLESRLRSQEVVEERLLTFLGEAESTEDLLAISQDLEEVQSEIERVTGRMNYLENQVAFSTVTIEIQERAVHVDQMQDQESLHTFERAQSLFMNTVNFLLTALSQVVVFLIGLSPVIVPLAVIAGAVYWFTRRRKKKEQKRQE